MLLPKAPRALLLGVLLVGTSGHAGRDPVHAPSQVDGRQLAAELGCGGCHTGMPEPGLARSRAPRFGPGSTPLPADFVFGYLADPQPRRDDIGPTRMPDFSLDERERLALALFLGSPDGGGEVTDAARARHADVDADLGRRIFDRLGCAACHQGVTETATPGGPDLTREGVRVRAPWLRAFLARPSLIRRNGHPGSPGARMPDFGLTAEEVDALTRFLGGLGEPFADLGDSPLFSLETLRARTQLESRLACLGCHQVGSEGGRIGPSLNGLSERLRPGFVLEMILDPRRAAPGSPMPHQPVLAPDARRIARYLLDLEGQRDALQPRSLADAPAWIESPAGAPGPAGGLYARDCAACHGASGGGDGWNAAWLPAPPTAHSDSTLMSRRPDDTLYDGISAGAWVLDGSPRMPPFGGALSPSEIRSLVAHIRTLCSCEAPGEPGAARRTAGGGRAGVPLRRRDRPGNGTRPLRAGPGVHSPRALRRRHTSCPTGGGVPSRSRSLPPDASRPQRGPS